jgi:preprotein translocase subunit SecA
VSFLRRLLGGTRFEPDPDGVWPTVGGKLEALAAEAERVREDGAVLVLAHFESTLGAVRHVLGEHSAEPDHLTATDVREVVADPRVGAVTSALATRFTAAPAPVRAAPEASLSVLVAERYPTPDRDASVCAAASALPYRARVRFFLSLEDELIRRFCGARMQAALDALGLQADDELSHPMIARAVANAQRKVAKRTRADLDSASPADWFQVNLG